jgi:hypothetical protein
LSFLIKALCDLIHKSAKQLVNTCVSDRVPANFRSQNQISLLKGQQEAPCEQWFLFLGCAQTRHTRYGLAIDGVAVCQQYNGNKQKPNGKNTFIIASLMYRLCLRHPTTVQECPNAKGGIKIQFCVNVYCIIICKGATPHICWLQTHYIH